jgi:hypothetical protein
MVSKMFKSMTLTVNKTEKIEAQDRVTLAVFSCKK